MKKIMIMGAGIYQVPLIRRARQMGIYTIVVSIPGDYPGFALADEALYINTTDEEAVLRAARERKVDGIVTVGTDVAVITIGRVCEELHLCGLSFASARISTDKSLMKECFARAGVRTARFLKFSLDTPAASVLEQCSGLDFPLIIKTVDSSGSRGITRIDRPEQLAAAVEAVRAVTRRDYYLVEEFITGEDFGAQAFVYDGEILFVLPHGNYQFHGDTGVPAGHYVPYPLEAEALEDMKKQVTGAIRAMGLDYCAVNADLILKDGKTYIVELTGRGGATGLSELDSVYLGVDLYEQILRAALGERPRFPEDGGPKTACACKLLQSPATGKLGRLEDRNPSEEADLVEVVLDHRAGEPVRAFRVGPDRIGHVITKGKTLSEAQEALERCISRITVEVDA